MSFLYCSLIRGKVYSTCLALGFTTLTAQADIVIFQDDFELGTIGSTPVATVGSYVTPATNSLVIDAASASPLPPAPASGSNLLHINAPSSVGIRSYASFTTQVATPGTTITSKVDLVTMAGYGIQFGLASPNTPTTSPNTVNQHAIIVMLNTDGNLQLYKNGAYVNTGLTHTTGVWQTYELAYTIGSTDAILRAGDNEVTISDPFLDRATGAQLGPLTEIHRAFLATGVSTAVGYADNWTVTVTPEPGSAALTLIGSGLLLLSRRGKGLPRD